MGQLNWTQNALVVACGLVMVPGVFYQFWLLGAAAPVVLIRHRMKGFPPAPHLPR
jgi:hypothetical protein